MYLILCSKKIKSYICCNSVCLWFCFVDHRKTYNYQLSVLSPISLCLTQNCRESLEDLPKVAFMKFAPFTIFMIEHPNKAC